MSSPPSFFFEDSPPPPPPSSSRPANQPVLCTPPPLSAQSRRAIHSTTEKLARAISRNDSAHKRNLLNELCQQVATTPVSASPKQRVLNSAEWDNMVTRLYSHKELRDGRVLESADKLKLREQAPCTFTPKLNERSLRLASMSGGGGGGGGDIASRSLDHHAKRDAKLNEERLLLQQVQDRELTFHPVVNSANNSSVRARVMTDNLVQRKLDYAKQVERRREQDFLDTHTFSPSLNARSMELTQNRACNAGETTPSGKPPVAKPPYDSPSFHPQINSHSRKLVHSRANNNLPAFERLYELSVAARRARGLGE